jgi:hypothetical protein
MSIDISQQTEARLTEEAKRQGVSVDALLEQLLNQRAASPNLDKQQAPELPILHLGPMGPLHRRDIYNDVR